jgi:ATP-dependent protease ClpP protease subunit
VRPAGGLVEAGVDVLDMLVDVDVDTVVTLDDGAETM